MIATTTTAAAAAAPAAASAGCGIGGGGSGGAAWATAAAAATDRLALKTLKQGDFLLDLGHLPCFRDGPTLFLGAVAGVAGAAGGGGDRGGGVLRGADSGTQWTAFARTTVFGQAVV